MSTIRQIRRPLLPGETVPPIPSLYEQIASVKGGIAPVTPQPCVPESIVEEEDEEDENW
jgi:hypothetical protein